MVAPISAPMLQIVAIPRERVGEEVRVNEKVQGHPILQKTVHGRDRKVKRDQGISHRNLIPQQRGHTDYIMAGSVPNVSDRYSACDQTFLQGRS